MSATRSYFEDSVFLLKALSFVMLYNIQVEGKGYGFAHVSSSQGPKAIFRFLQNSCMSDSQYFFPFRAVQVLNGTHLKGRNLNIEIRCYGRNYSTILTIAHLFQR